MNPHNEIFKKVVIEAILKTLPKNKKESPLIHLWG